MVMDKKTAAIVMLGHLERMEKSVNISVSYFTLWQYLEGLLSVLATDNYRNYSYW